MAVKAYRHRGKGDRRAQAVELCGSLVAHYPFVKPPRLDGGPDLHKLKLKPESPQSAQMNCQYI